MPDKQMQKWFCYGKKDFCDTPHKCDKCNSFGKPYGGELRRVYENNYDRIRNMSVEEMAEFMDNVDTSPCSYCIGNCASMSCKDGFKKYLESEVDNNG